MGYGALQMEMGAMAGEENDQAAGLQPFQELSELRSDPAFPRHASQAKGQPPQALLPGGREGPDSLVRGAEGGGRNHGAYERGSVRARRRDRCAVPVGPARVRRVAAGGYLYWHKSGR